MLLHLKEFAQTLNIDQCRLLITEAFSSRGGIKLAKVLLDPSTEFPEESNNSWCICGKCQPMDNPIENVCCRQRCCVTTLTYFETGVLNTTILSIAIVNRYLFMTQSTLQLCTAKLLTGSGYFGNMDTLEEVIEALYRFAWSGQCVINIQPQMADTWASRSIKLINHKCLVMYLEM